MEGAVKEVATGKGTTLVVIEAAELQRLIRDAVKAEVANLTVEGPREVLNLEQAAELLDRNPRVVMKLVKEGNPKLPAHFISGREPRFRRSELLEWLNALPQQPKETEG